MERRERRLPVVALCFATALGFTARAAFADAAAPLPAVWTEQRLDFLHTGLATRYSCRDLRDKLRAILTALGARGDLKVDAEGCDQFGIRPRLGGSTPTAHLDFFAPEPDYGAHQGPPAAASGSLDARFEPFSIDSVAMPAIGAGDCELIEEFSREILPRFATRNLERRSSCAAFRAGDGGYALRGEILQASKPAAPASGR